MMVFVLFIDFFFLRASPLQHLLASGHEARGLGLGGWGVRIGFPGHRGQQQQQQQQLIVVLPQEG